MVEELGAFGGFAIRARPWPLAQAATISVVAQTKIQAVRRAISAISPCRVCRTPTSPIADISKIVPARSVWDQAKQQQVRVFDRSEDQCRSGQNDLWCGHCTRSDV